MKVEKTSLKGVSKITFSFFEDFRGRYVEYYDKNKYHKLGIDIDFVQDNIVVACKDNLRGIHGDDKTWKLMSCAQGRIYLVVVNCIKEDVNFGKWEGFTLTGENGIQILVPPKHGVGPFWLTDEAVFYYKQSTFYGEAKQFTYRFDDSRFNILWPIKDPILSKRDMLGEKNAV